MASSSIWSLSSGGSGGGGADFTVVHTFADLPDPVLFIDKIYVVEVDTGTWPFNKKPAGMYYSNGATWTYMDAYPEFVKDSNFAIQNAEDGTRVLKFSASGITIGQTVTLSVPNKDGTIALLDDISTSTSPLDLALIEHAGTGLNNPTGADLIIQTSATEMTILAQSGYISNNVNSRVRVEWEQFDNVKPTVAGINYVLIDINGQLSVDGRIFDVDQYIELGYVFAFDIGGGVYAITNILNTPKYNSRFTSRVNDFWTLVLRALVVEGTGVSAGVTPFTLSVAPGEVFINGVKKAIGNNVIATSFTKYFNTADLGWLPLLTDPDVLSPEIWNDVTQPADTALQPVPTGYWKQDVVFRTSDGSVFVICGQAVYATEELADKAPLALAPAQLANVAVYLAKINLQQGSSSISGSSVSDIRPYLPRVFGFGSASAGSVISHNSLTDLTTGDPHTQYLLKSVASLTYAEFNKGVTNGDSHTHISGDGSQISYTSLSNLPTLGTASSKDIPATGDASDTEVVLGSDTRMDNDRTPIVHGNDKHSATYIVQADAVIPNVAITGATATKITYDSKGLVTSGSSATTSDIADSLDKRYVSDANLIVINNTSGTNTGDEVTGNLTTTGTNLVIQNGTDSVIGTGTTVNLSATPEVTEINITGLASDTVLENTTKALSDYSYKAWNFSKNVYTLTKEPTGFSIPANVHIIYNADRTVTLSGTWEAYWRGKLLTNIISGWSSDPHANIDGYYYLKWNGTAFSWSTESWEFSDFQIAAVHYTVSNEKWGVREPHGFMPWSVHKELHERIGTYVESGGDLSSFVLDSTTAINRRPDISQTIVIDEDAPTTNVALTSKVYTHHWLEDDFEQHVSVSNSDIVSLLGSNPYYNEYTGTVWQKTLMPANTYQAIWLMSIPVTEDNTSQQYAYLWVLGQSVNTSFTVINALKTSDIQPGNIIQSAEFIGVQKVIIFYNGIDWVIKSTTKLTGGKAQQIQPSIGSYLSMVDADDITIEGDGTDFDPISVVDGVFVRNVGHSGGQTVHGGLLTSESLTLYNNSTDNQGISIEADGTVSTNVTNYETLVISDNDLPNKKYVNDEDKLLVNLTGRSGGQIIKGGVLTSESLTLHNNNVDNLGISIEEDGTLSTNVTSYEHLVTSDNDIPNKKYIDETVYIPLQQNIEMHGTGLVSGGAITVLNPSGVIEFKIDAGIGYISNNTTALTRITWNNIPTATTLGDGINYIRINVLGQLDITLDPSYSIDDYIELGYIFTGGGNTLAIETIQTPKYVSKFPNRVSAFASYGVRALIQDGMGVTESLTPLGLRSASGTLHVNLAIYNLSPTEVFSKMFNTTNYGWIFNTNSPNLVDPNLWNDVTQPVATALKPLTAGYWKKDVIFRNPSGNMYYIYGQAEYATEELAKAAPQPTVADSLANVAVYLCTIVSQSTDTSIGNRLSDIRPYLPRVFGFGTSSSGSSTRHGDLSGLLVDDHTQYFNETRGDLRYAKLANGVTNGDSHDHSGGDGATISYNNLSDKPFIPTPVVDAKYILQQPYTGLNNAQSLSALATGIVKNTTTTGVLSIATSNVDYLAPNADIVAATKTKVTYNKYGIITGGADATTADIADSSNKRYVTDAQLVVIGNTSNTNTGNVTLATNNGLSLTNQVIGMGTPSTITTGTTNNVTGTTHTHALTLPAIPADISSVPYIIKGTSTTGVSNAQAMGNLATGIVKNTTTTGVQSIAVAGTDYVAPNVAIVAGTGTKVTYDAKGLVTNSTSATATDIGLGNVTNNAQLTIANNLSDLNNKQTALNNVTQVSSATNEYVLTKDTSTGNALWKVATGGSSLPSGTANQTLRHNGTSWVASSALLNDDTNISGNFYEDVTTASTASTSHTIDWNTGGLQQLTLAHTPVTLSFTAPSGGIKSLRIILIQDATGARNIVFPSTVSFEDNLPPLLNKAPNAVTVLDFHWTGSAYRFTRPVYMGRQRDTNFYSIATDPNSGLVAAAISSGTTALIAGEVGSPTSKVHSGIARLSSSTTTNSGYRFLTDITSHLISGGDAYICDFNLITATNTTMRFGFHDATTVTAPVDGVYLQILTGGVLTGNTSSNSVRSTTASSYTLTISTWYRASIIVNYAGTQVDFYLFNDAGTQVWTDVLTTNLPTGAGRNCGIGAIATNTGTTAVIMAYVDYMRWGNQCNY